MENEIYETIENATGLNGEPKTHDTFVLGINDGRVTFLKSYDFKSQREEAMKDLDFVQSGKFTGWFISHVGGWVLKSKLDEGEECPINIPLPIV